MEHAEGYDVLRLIEHNRNCYISSEYVEGKPLIRWLKYHPNLSKKQLFTWIHEMARQLDCIHKCRGKPCYRYVNPYSIIITEERELYFLDMSAQSNEKMLSAMRRRNVREHFLPKEESYYQNESVSLDIYGLGKTIQYLLSVSEPVPSLMRGEEVRFQKIISRSLNRHSKKAYTSVSELRKQIPAYHVSERHLTKKTKVLITAAVLIFTAAGGILHQKEEKYQPSAQKEATKKAEAILPEEKGEENKAYAMELGFLYFLDKKDYEKSEEYFSEIPDNKGAQGLARLSEYMQVGETAGKEKELEEVLAETEENITKKSITEERENYYRCLIEGYRLLNSADAAGEIIRLGKKCVGADEDVRRNISGYMASAYEKTGELNKAIEEYTEMLDWMTGESAREELYKKLVMLWKEEGEPDKAGTVCRQGIEELGTSTELRLIHIGMQCADSGIEREICAQTIKKYRTEIPEIIEEQEFKKLEKEYGIVIEGENVWVGR